MNTESADTPDSAHEAAFAAARAGDLPQLRAALDQVIAAGQCNDAGDSLLMLAAYHGHEQCVACLLQRGADPDQVNRKGQHPLAGVCFKGNLAVARALLDGGANPEGSATAARSPLMYAAMYNHPALTRLLLQRGADPRRRDNDGKRARDLAAEMRAVHTLDLLDEPDEPRT